MPEEGKEKETKRICPFNSKMCMEGKCALWTNKVITFDPRIGAPHPMEMCSFDAIVLLLGTPRMQPQAINLQGLNIPGLKIPALTK